MKNVMKSFLVVVLCLIFMVSAIGCGKEKQPVDPNVNVSGETGLKLPTFELAGNTKVKVISHDESVFKNAEQVFKDGYGGEVEVTAVAQGDVNTKFINSVLANDPYDLVTGAYTPATIKKNIIAPLDQHIDFTSELWASIYELNKIWSTGGKYYVAIPSESRSTVVWYNKEIFEEFAVKTPSEYLADDNWNWDTMKEVAKKLTLDSDSDGSTDIYGLAFDNPWDLLTTTGAGILKYDENGKASNDLGSERVIRTMNYYSGLINLDKSVVLNGGKTKFTQGKLAMFYAGAWHGVNFTDQLDAKTIMIAPEPKDPQADKYYISGGGYAYALAANAKNPKGAAALLCSARFVAAEAENAERKGEIKMWNIFNGNEECNNALADMRLNYTKYIGTSIRDYQSYNLLSVPWPMWCGGITENQPWATVMEELNPIVNSAIEDAEELQLVSESEE